MNAAYRPLLYLTAILLFLQITSVFGTKLSLPVELSIENGDYNNCIVNITKNGIQQQSLPGKSELKIKLEFNSDYILTFTKPGYISKKIAVNTTVTAARQQQLFDPYKIGVKLFKQYEGINIVVYNQPVAKIKFNPTLDDFDYDVDYTKSILSQLHLSDQELEIRASEERRLIASGELPKEGFEINAASSERYAQFGKISGAQGISPANKSTDDSSYQIFPSQDPVDTAILNGGADPFNHPGLNTGNDAHPSKAVSGGNDGKIKTTNAQGTDKAAGVLNTDAGQDNSRALSGADNYDGKQTDKLESATAAVAINKIASNTGNDGGKSAEVASEIATTKTKELTVEPTRTITTIKMNEGPNAVIYRKVLYNWGGLYYFKNLSYSISQDIFETGTGEK